MQLIQISNNKVSCKERTWIQWKDMKPLLSNMSPFIHCALVINGEKATLETPTFAQKRQRTLDMLIRSLYQDLMPDLHKVNASSERSLCTSYVASYPCWHVGWPVVQEDILLNFHTKLNEKEMIFHFMSLRKGSSLWLLNIKDSCNLDNFTLVKE